MRGGGGGKLTPFFFCFVFNFHFIFYFIYIKPGLMTLCNNCVVCV